MRLAMIARCRERGLGTMTALLARLLEPAKVLVVKRDSLDGVDPCRFPTARWSSLDARGQLPDDDIEWLTDDVDVLYSAETFYDDRVLTLARAKGVRTVLHGMWEYLPYRCDPTKPRPDLFAAPSPWHLSQWPQPCVHLPVPVDDRFEARPVRHVRTVVHAAGAFAKGDRNGTQIVLEAVGYLRSAVTVVVRAQGNVRRPHFRGPATLRIEPATTHHWQVFADADAALLPRRYGGLSLPLQEATAQGLPVIGLSRERSAGYEHAAVVRCSQRSIALPCGPVDYAEADPRLLARAIDHLVEDADQAEEMSARSAQEGRRWRWDALCRTYSDALASGAP